MAVSGGAEIYCFEEVIVMRDLTEARVAGELYFPW